jgi:thiamine biosynthesis lipoprotein
VSEGVAARTGDVAAAGVSAEGSGFVYRFDAMASPCEVRIDTDQSAVALAAGRAAEAEARRIETKFSRYRADSVVGRINGARGRPVEVDGETAHLLDFADQCFVLSQGRFDVTSGVLRRIWRFDGSDRLPSRDQILGVLPLIGWRRATWNAPHLTLPEGMEIDFGGIGKEYAVDRALAAVQRLTDAPALVNFGGDLRASSAHADGSPWLVAIESVEHEGCAAGVIELRQGALATSGDARRFLARNGIRYSHILDPRTGRPVRNAPRSVTVAAPTCIHAGMVATLAMLQGAKAEAFLKREGAKAWCIR